MRFHDSVSPAIGAVESTSSPSPDESPRARQREMRALLDEADRAPLRVPPPVGNTGVEPSNSGIDYVQLTHADTSGGVWFDILGIPQGEWTELGHGKWGYRRMRVAGGVCVLYDGAEGMGSHVELDGAACRELEFRGVMSSWPAFFKRAIEEYGCKGTRLDLYKDDRSGELVVGECVDKLRRGEVRSRSKMCRRQESFDIGEENTGETVYIGRRGSDTMVRVYNKALQLCPADGDRVAWLAEYGPHTRVEIELRRDRADQVMKMIAGRGFVPKLIASLINSHVEFKEEYARDHNGNRVPMWGVWERLMGAVERITLLARAVRHTLLEAECCLDRMWGPTIAALAAFHEGKTDWVRNMAARNMGRMKPKHRRMLWEAVEAQEVGW